LTTVQKDSLVCTPVRVGHYGKGGQGQRIYSVVGKSVTLSANGGGQGAKTGLYKIDLPDGDYIIRKLTPVEAERLQTLPDNYTVGISNSQRYKCIGNGWTVDVIAHILSSLTEKGGAV
ncbi:MAG: DNA cytosine methyltransferase, partial [Prevotella sp.]|nr:DNA cytosine methyltransferase [Prevotella sp.]